MALDSPLQSAHPASAAQDPHAPAAPETVGHAATTAAAPLGPGQAAPPAAEPAGDDEKHAVAALLAAVSGVSSGDAAPMHDLQAGLGAAGQSLS